MFVVFRLGKFDLEPSPNQGFVFLYPITVETAMVGFLPVYETREQALKDYPDAEIKEIKLKQE